MGIVAKRLRTLAERAAEHARLTLAVGSLLAVVPLWVSRLLPFVDSPQHLHLISVLHRLEDATTLYPSVFEARGGLTPYLGYYHLVSGLHWLLPLEGANRVFLTAYVAVFIGGLGFLLRASGRETWPAVLATPFAYGDSLSWGFINSVSATALAFVTMGALVTSLRARNEAVRRRWAWAFGGLLLSVFIFHVAALLFLALAIPWLLLTVDASSPGNSRAEWLLRRRPAVLACLPMALVGVGWLASRFSGTPNIRPGEPWFAWGPMFSRENLVIRSFDENLRALPDTLAGTFIDGSDRIPLLLAVTVMAAAGMTAWLFRRPHLPPQDDAASPSAARSDLGPAGEEAKPRTSLGAGSPEPTGAVSTGNATTRRTAPDASFRENAESGEDEPGLLHHRWAMAVPSNKAAVPAWVFAGLGGLALLLYFVLPFDIRGTVYLLNPRFAAIGAALLAVSVPTLRGARARTVFTGLALCVPLTLAAIYVPHLRALDREAAPLLRLAERTPQRPRVMGLIFDPTSTVVRHPVYLHAAAVLAERRGGLTNFSFASTPQSPLRYQDGPPPTFPSEWNPSAFQWETHGPGYDTFLLRGPRPDEMFGPGFANALEVVAQEETWSLLVRKR